MTAARLTHDQIRRSLEEKGLRCTPHRLAVYDYLAAGCHHPTAEEVYRAVREGIPRLGLATVYKALEALVACGAAARLTTTDGAGPARYDARGDDHYHFRCLRTGEVRDLPIPFDPDLVERLDPRIHEQLRREGIRVTGYRLEILGYRASENSAAEGPADDGPSGLAAEPKADDRTSMESEHDASHPPA